jgi:hypothetical protein
MPSRDVTLSAVRLQSVCKSQAAFPHATVRCVSNVLRRVRSDIALQRTIDERHDSPQASLAARMRAVVVAQQRMTRREPGANYELRQALVDLASVAELIAEGLPAPVSTRRRARPIGTAGRSPQSIDRTIRNPCPACIMDRWLRSPRTTPLKPSPTRYGQRSSKPWRTVRRRRLNWRGRCRSRCQTSATTSAALHKLGAIALVRERQVRGAVEHTYTATVRLSLRQEPL